MPRQINDTTREKARKYCRDWYWRNRERQGKYQLWSLARRRAKDNGLEFTLKREDVIVPDTCPILGIPLTHGSELGRDHWPSIDRVDNNRGYTPDNILVVSYKVNRMKSNATLKELIRLGEWAKDVLDSN